MAAILLSLVSSAGALNPTAAQTYGVSVTPDGGTTPPRQANTNGGPFGYQASFTVQNTGSTSNTYTITCTTSPNVTCLGTSPPSVTIGAGLTSSVSATYRVGAAGIGTLSLHAVGTNAADSGWYSVPVVSYGVTVTPDNGTATLRPANGTYSETFTVTNTGSATNTFSISCSSPPFYLTCTGVSPQSLTLDAGAPGTVAAIYATGSSSGTGLLQVTATGTNASDDGSYAVTVAIRGAAVRAEITERQHFAATSNAQRFFVKNLQTGSATYNLTPVCSGTATGCAVAPDSLMLAPGESRVATLSYTVGSAGATGTGMVKAASASSSILPDSAAVALTSVGAPFPVVSIVGVNPGTTLERDLCLTIAAGSAAAFECGDLRIVHALPAIRTLNKPRVPTLLYNSATADPYPIVAATVTLASGSPRPDSVEAVLKVGGVTKDSGRWAGTDWDPGATRRIALRAVALSDTMPLADTTKVLDYTLAVATIYLGPPGSYNGTAVAGRLVLVNRRRSSFGAGWWLAGLERLSVLSDSSRLWVGGDGSARVYAPAGPNVWVAPRVDRPDTLTKVATSYVRRLPGGITIWFNATGQHDSTVNRLGHRTSFAYTSGRLASITLPSQGGSQTYTFAYDGNSKLTSVTAPGSRITTVRVGAQRVDSIRDPDNTTVRFSYANPSSRRIETRTDRRNNVTSYSYDAAKKLARARIALPGDSIRIGFRAADVQGLQSATPKTATDTANVYTSFFGARQFTHGPDSIGQETKFWLDRFGAPRRIVNPLGHQTLVKREDGEWPALATELVAANGFITRAGYDGRGNLLRSTAVAPLGPGQGDAITRYHWDSRWDFADSVVTPTLVITTLAYDTLNGNRLWQQVGSNSARRVTFRYGNTLKLLSSTLLPLTPPDSVEYDPLGNVAATRTPRGFWTSSYKDALGRDTLVVTPIDSTDLTKGGSNANRLQARVVYTVADQDTLAQTTAPAKSGAPAQTVTVRQSYDLEGNRLSLTRQGSAPDAGIGPITTQWRYDLAGRQVAEVAPDAQKDSTVYDPASNVVGAVTRRGPVIMMAYDALNRLTARSLPQVFYPDRIEGIARDSGRSTMNTHYPWLPNSGNGYLILAEQHTFTYDSLGNVRTADNPSARVRRTYTTSGLLTAETLYVRTVAPIDEGGTFALHKYVLAYRYDLEGRRIGLRYPSQLAPAGSDSVRYAYDTQTGALAQVWDLLGNNFRYHLNARGELDTLYLPNGVVDSRTYDADGNLARHAVSGGRRETTLLYDGRGKQLSHANTYGVHDTLTATYSGMGHLVASHYVSRDVNSLGDSLRIVTSDSMANDALGNRLNEDAKATTTLNGFPHSNNHNGLSGYHANTGRLAYTARPSARDTMRYDAAGNIEFSWQLPGQGASQIEDRASYYAADGTLRAADYRVEDSPQEVVAPIKFTFEEYRYDALGRRVWVRARRDCDWIDYKAECRYLAFVRRTVWDGAQELAEIQMPGRDVTPPDTMENDTAAVRREVGSPEGYEDTNPFWGRVLYTFGIDLDQPLSMTRLKYASQPSPTATWAVWDPVSIVPRWNSEGSADGGFFGAGAAPCRTLDGQQRCMKLAWPFAWNASARALYTLDFWHGTLTENKRDKAQTLYRRNRAYDPGTGRFTQEDPIGLAGGLNLYGFAGGDPVNFTDPFGLDTLKILDAQLGKVVASLRARNPAFDRQVGDVERSTVVTNLQEGTTDPQGNHVMGGDVVPIRVSDGQVQEQTVTINSGSIREARAYFQTTGRGSLDIKDVVGHEFGHAGSTARTKQWLSCPDPDCSVRAENAVRRDRDRPPRTRY